MATFDQPIQAQSPGSYVGLSEGIRSSPNTAVGEALTAVAGAIDTAVKVTDEGIKASIEKDIFDEVDAVQAEFGIPEATDLEADAAERSERTAPAGVRRAGEQLQRLQDAYARGNLKESHYWARMNNMVRQLRGKYPGYRGEIDRMVAGVTGARPANALRSALMREWEEAAGASGKEQDEMNKLVDWAAKNGRLPADFYQRLEGQNPYSHSELQAHVARKQRDEAERADRRAAMSEATEAGTMNEKTAEKNFRIEANQVVTTLLQDTTSTIGADYKRLNQALLDAQRMAGAGNPMSQQDAQQLAAQFGQLKALVRQTLHQQFLQSWDGNPEHSYNAHLDKTKMEAIVETAMVPITIMEQALTSDNPWGVLKAQSAYLDAMKSDDSRSLLESVPWVREMANFSNVLGADMASVILNQSPALQASVDEAMFNYVKTRKAFALSNGDNVANGLADGVAKELGTEYYNGLIEDWVRMAEQVTKGEVPIDVVRNNVAYMFGADANRVFSMLDDNAKHEWFRKVASPTVSRQLMKLRDLGDMDSWNQYQGWVANGFQILFQDSVQTIQSMVVDPGHFRITWDDKNKQFRAELRVLGDTYVNHPFATNVKRINDAITVVRPIIEANDGDSRQEVLELLMRMGYAPNAPRQPGMLESALSGVTGGMITQFAAALAMGAATGGADTARRAVNAASGAK